MRREDLSGAIGNISDRYIMKALETYPEQNSINPEKVIKMNRTTIYRPRRLLALVAAACLMAALGTVAFAANLFGLRDMLKKVMIDLPDEAVQDIEVQDETAEYENGEWSAHLSETIWEGSTASLIVTVNAGEQYLLVPTDADPSIDRYDDQMTLQEYAEENGKTILLVNAGLSWDTEGLFTQTEYFERTADNEIAVLVFGSMKEGNTEEAIATSCTVYVNEYGADQTDEIQKVEIPFTMRQGTVEEIGTFYADDNVDVGIQFQNATVVSTPLGYDVTAAVMVEDIDQIGKITCDELDSFEGGLVFEDGNTWNLHWYHGKGEIQKSLHIQVFDGEENLLGNFEFQLDKMD